MHMSVLSELLKPRNRLAGERDLIKTFKHNGRTINRYDLWMPGGHCVRRDLYDRPALMVIWFTICKENGRTTRIPVPILNWDAATQTYTNAPCPYTELAQSLIDLDDPSSRRWFPRQLSVDAEDRMVTQAAVEPHDLAWHTANAARIAAVVERLPPRPGTVASLIDEDPDAPNRQG